MKWNTLKQKMCGMKYVQIGVANSHRANENTCLNFLPFSNCLGKIIIIIIPNWFCITLMEKPNDDDGNLGSGKCPMEIIKRLSLFLLVLRLPWHSRSVSLFQLCDECQQLSVATKFREFKLDQNKIYTTISSEHISIVDRWRSNCTPFE